MLGVLISGCTDKTSAPAPWSACFNGLSNHGRTADKIYVTSGKESCKLLVFKMQVFPIWVDMLQEKWVEFGQALLSWQMDIG